MKKFILCENDTTKLADGTILYRIQAVEDFGAIKAEDFGGLVEKESNLSHEGMCWIEAGAWVTENAHVCEDAFVGGHAYILGNVVVKGNVVIKGHHEIVVAGNAVLDGNLILSA